MEQQKAIADTEPWRAMVMSLDNGEIRLTLNPSSPLHNSQRWNMSQEEALRLIRDLANALAVFQVK